MSQIPNPPTLKEQIDPVTHRIYELLAERSKKLNKPNRRIIDSFNADDEFATEIEALIAQKQIEARIEETKESMAWQFMNEADLFIYIKHQQDRIAELKALTNKTKES